MYDKINDKNVTGAPIVICKPWEIDKPYSFFGLHLITRHSNDIIMKAMVEGWRNMSELTLPKQHGASD